MKTTRRRFLKQSATAFSITMLAPRFALSAPPSAPAAGRHILVVLQLNGGNDGFNTVIPYTDDNYHRLRPNLAFKPEELHAADTVINDRFAFHPALKGLKDLYAQGRLAAVMGVGYPNPDLSHAISTDIWQTANINQGAGLGWLGRYADTALLGIAPLPAAAISFNFAPKAVLSQKVNIPLFSRLGDSGFRTSDVSERDVIIKTFRDLNARSFPADSLTAKLAEAGAEAERGSGVLEQALASYHSSVTYDPTSPLAQALRSVAILAAVVPSSVLFHVTYFGAFDSHARQVGSEQDQYRNRLIGTHAVEMQRLAEAIKSFDDDISEQGLADQTVLVTYSEFGRRPNENASNGTDHGTASSLFVIGNAVKGGDLYGSQPSLDPADYDAAGNVRFTTDFRSVYATLLDRWMPNGDSRRTLGGDFAALGFL